MNRQRRIAIAILASIVIMLLGHIGPASEPSGPGNDSVAALAAP